MHRLDCHVFIDLLHLLRSKLRDADSNGMLLALCEDRNRRVRGQRAFRGGQPPALGRQAGAHHVRTGEEETDRSAVDSNLWQHEGICGEREEVRSVSVGGVVGTRSECGRLSLRTLVQEAQRGVKRPVKVLKEQRLAVQRVDGDMLSAVGAMCQLHASRSLDRRRHPRKVKKQESKIEKHRPLDEYQCLLLRPYLLQRLRIYLPLREDGCAYRPLHGRFYACLPRDIGARLKSGLERSTTISTRNPARGVRYGLTS